MLIGMYAHEAAASVGHQARAATWEDIAAVVELMRRCDLHAWGATSVEENDVRGAWRLPRLSMASDTWLVVTHGGDPAGYGIVADQGEESITSIGLVDPGHRGRGVGSVLLDHIVRRAREIGGAGRVLRQSVPADDRDAAELLSSRGFARPRALLRMSAPLVPQRHTSPAGVVIRPYETEGDAPGTAETMNEAFATHHGFLPRPFEEWHAELQVTATDPRFHFLVAEADGEVVAVITSMAREDGGWIADLAVRPGWRRRGIGEALVRGVMGEFHERGLSTVSLNVDPLNETGATQLYERLGFRSDRRYDVYEKVL